MVSPSFLQDDQHKLQREFLTQQYSFDGFWMRSYMNDEGDFLSNFFFLFFVFWFSFGYGIFIKFSRSTSSSYKPGPQATTLKPTTGIRFSTE
jgi:hypothetical protein